jgi:hypothetical protein
MITISDLQTSLLDLLYELEGTEIKIIIGGGYGIYLKTDYVQKRGVRTLLNEWPEPRSTNDLDLFLRPELLIEAEKSITTPKRGGLMVTLKGSDYCFHNLI